LSALNIANQCELHYKNSKNQRLQVELALLKMCHIQTAIQLNKNPNMQAATAAVDKKKTTDVKTGETLPKPQGPPAAEQPATKPTAAKPTEALPSEPAAPPTSPTVVIPKWADISITASIPDLNNVFDEDRVQERDEPQYLKGNEFEPFSEADFIAQWDRLAQQAKQE